MAAAGLLDLSIASNATALGAACLNGPQADFVLGDATYAPTPGPPPDCGNGWWNFTTSQCDYWIPPPPPKCEPSASGHRDLGLAALGGAVGTAIVGAIVLKIGGRRSSGYSPLP